MFRRGFGLWCALVALAAAGRVEADEPIPDVRLPREWERKLADWMDVVLESRPDKGVVKGRKIRTKGVLRREVYRVGEPGKMPHEVGFQFFYAVGGEEPRDVTTIAGTPFSWRPGMSDEDAQKFQLRYSGWDPELTLSLAKGDLPVK